MMKQRVILQTKDGTQVEGHLVGQLYTWWGRDPLPEQTCIEGFTASPTDDAELLAYLSSLPVELICERLAAGQRPFVGWLYATPVAYGWAATTHAAIGELGLSFHMSPGNRYLWDFVTLPPWRHQGIYRCLLHAVMQQELADATRFWIGQDSDTTGPQRGIGQVGFQPVAALYALEIGGIGMGVLTQSEKIQAAALLLNVPLLTIKT